ncbi:hypothetical protein Tco_0222989 [Tanacetum coccineum]
MKEFNRRFLAIDDVPDACDTEGSSFLAFLELLPDFPGLRWLWRGVSEVKNVSSKSLAANFLPGGWVLAGEIFLYNLSFKALVQVVLGRGSSYFTISSLQLDLKAWKLE